jgi:hypothetical protein
MSKIYLVAERIFPRRYDETGLCGRPEHVFISREEAEEYCYHLNRLVRPIRDHDDGCDEASETIRGFCHLERGERDELPDDAWGVFEDPVPEPYWIVEVERKDTEMVLAFNQQTNPTYLQCHEVLRFFGLRSIFHVLYQKPLGTVGPSGYDKNRRVEYYAKDDYIILKYGSKLSDIIQPSFALSSLLSIENTLPLLKNKYIEYHIQVDGGEYYAPYTKPISRKSFIQEAQLQIYEEKEEEEEIEDDFDLEHFENLMVEYWTVLSDEDYYELHLKWINNEEEIH